MELITKEILDHKLESKIFKDVDSELRKWYKDYEDEFPSLLVNIKNNGLRTIHPIFELQLEFIEEPGDIFPPPGTIEVSHINFDTKTLSIRFDFNQFIEKVYKKQSH